MEAMEKDFEDLVESEDVDQEEDEKSILDYFDDEGDLIAEEDDSEEEVEETEDSLIADDDTDDEEDDTDTITSEEYELFIKEASDEEFDALPDEFFADIPDEFFEFSNSKKLFSVSRSTFFDTRVFNSLFFRFGTNFFNVFNGSGFPSFSP